MGRQWRPRRRWLAPPCADRTGIVVGCPSERMGCVVRNQDGVGLAFIVRRCQNTAEPCARPFDSLRLACCSLWFLSLFFPLIAHVSAGRSDRLSGIGRRLRRTFFPHGVFSLFFPLNIFLLYETFFRIFFAPLPRVCATFLARSLLYWMSR